MQTFESRNPKRLVRPARGLLLMMAVTVVFASTGCKKVAVPYVVTMDLEQAKQTLAAANLKLGNVTGPQMTGSFVLTQSIPSGQQVKANTVIDLTIDAPVPVPDLTNNKLTDAVSALQIAGLQVVFIKQPTLKLFGGAKVLSQSPLPATLVHRGTPVMVTVSSPPDLGALVGLVTKEPAYANLNPEYRQVLDQFLK